MEYTGTAEPQLEQRVIRVGAPAAWGAGPITGGAAGGTGPGAARGA